MTEPQTANEETCLISPAFAGSCSAAPSSREIERAAADAEHAADGHDEAEERRAEGDRGEQGGVVQRADEAGVDDVVDGADDHRGGHRHAEVHEGADDRGGGEVPAVGADGVGLRRGFEVRGVHGWLLSGQVERAPTGRRRGDGGGCWSRRLRSRSRVGCGSSAVILREQGVQGGPLGLVERGEDRLVGGGHRGVEPGDELDARRGRVDAFAALVAALGAALDQAAPLEPLQQARDARRAGAGHLGDVALDRTGVLRPGSRARRPARGLSSRSRIQSSPALRCAQPIQRTSSRVLVSSRCVHGQNSNC